MTVRQGQSGRRRDGARRRIGAAIGLGLGLALAGCSHRPIEVTGCNLPLQRLAITGPAADALATGRFSNLPTLAGSYDNMVSQALQRPSLRRNARPDAVERPASLFLSGGSQNGAFGAGFIEQWRVGNGGELPRFRVVTGISTGALIGATVFPGYSQHAVRGYMIESEADILRVLARGRIGQIRAGAVGTLDPLRQRIDDLLDVEPGDDALIAETARANNEEGRKFFIGIVDVNDGNAYTVDMTEMASRWLANPDQRPRIKQCYIEALIASSTVPFAAVPVHIDGRMLIDGGVRFGIFRAVEEQGYAEAARAAEAGNRTRPVNYLVVNSTLDVQPRCAFVANADGSCPATGQLRDWNIIGLGARTVELLVNQLSRFSALEATGGLGDHYFVRIELDAVDHVFDGKSCQQWRDLDLADRPRPLEFHKRQMRCLIDYGRTRSEKAQWWLTGR